MGQGVARKTWRSKSLEGTLFDCGSELVNKDRSTDAQHFRAGRAKTGVRKLCRSDAVVIRTDFPHVDDDSCSVRVARLFGVRDSIAHKTYPLGP